MSRRGTVLRDPHMGPGLLLVEGNSTRSWRRGGWMCLERREPVPADLRRRREPGSGIFRFAAILALSGPFLPFFWSDRRASLGGFLPLGFMALTAYRIAGQLYSSIAIQFIDGYPAMRIGDRHAIWGA